METARGREPTDGVVCGAPTISPTVGWPRRSSSAPCATGWGHRCSSPTAMPFVSLFSESGGRALVSVDPPTTRPGCRRRWPEQSWACPSTRSSAVTGGDALTVDGPVHRPADRTPRPCTRGRCPACSADSMVIHSRPRRRLWDRPSGSTVSHMTNLVLEGEASTLGPVAARSLITERQRLGLDRFDEVWDGVYHVAPNASSCPRAHRRRRGAGLGAAGQVGRFRVVGRMQRGGRRRLPGAGRRGLPTGGRRCLSRDRSAGGRGAQSARRDLTGSSTSTSPMRVEEVVVVDPVSRRCGVWTRGGHGYLEAPASHLLSVSMTDLDDEITWT